MIDILVCWSVHGLWLDYKSLYPMERKITRSYNEEKWYEVFEKDNSNVWFLFFTKFNLLVTRIFYTRCKSSDIRLKLNRKMQKLRLIQNGCLQLAFASLRLNLTRMSLNLHLLQNILVASRLNFVKTRNQVLELSFF